MTSSSASEASLATSTSRGRQEDAKDSACSTHTPCQPLAKPPPLDRSSRSRLLALGYDSLPLQAGRERACLLVAASILLDSSSEPGEQPQRDQGARLARLGEPHSSARNGCATVNTYALIIKS